jgi:type I restriction enzyme S subunit
MSFHEMKFGDLYETPSRNGLTKPKSVRGLGTKMVNMGEIFAHDRISSVSMDRVQLTPEEHITSLLKNEDLLFARQSLVLSGAGKCSIFLGDEEDVCFESHIIRVRLNAAKASRSFFYYLFRSPYGRNLIESIVEQGAGASGIRGSDLARLSIRVPDFSSQTAIASVLGVIDNKLDANRRMNDTLDTMARAIFRDWFLDFGPTRAKMEGRAPYLAPGLWALFPDQLDAEGKPKGWPEIRLADATSELRRGISPSYVDAGGVLVLNQRCIRARQVDFGPARRHDNAARPVGERELMRGDVLVNSTGVGTLGRTAQIWNLDEATVVDSHVTVVRPDNKQVTPYYLGLNLTGREPEIEALGEGSTGQTELSRARLGMLAVVKPPRALQLAFDDAVKCLIDLIASNAREEQILVSKRELLLHKLISGEIRIQEAENIVLAAQ